MKEQERRGEGGTLVDCLQMEGKWKQKTRELVSTAFIKNIQFIISSSAGH